MLTQTKNEPRVGAVVLNWNRPDDTLECLESLLSAARQRKLALVVCDNASTDDSVERLSQWAARHYDLNRTYRPHSVDSSMPSTTDWDFLLVHTGANKGYGGGNNVGIRRALERGRLDCIWILNNDTVVHEHALDALLDCAEAHPEVGAFGSTLLDHYSPDRLESAGGCRYNALTTVMKSVYRGRPLRDALAASGEVRLDYISGAAMFCRAEIFERIGLFDEQFFLYYEEIDFARRMREKGYSIRWCRDSLVYHKGAVSTGGRSTINPRESWRSNYHENRSTVLFTRKHHPRLLALAATFRFVGKSLAYLVHGRVRLFSALVAAYRDGLKKAAIGNAETNNTSSVLLMGTLDQKR